MAHQFAEGATDVAESTSAVTAVVIEGQRKPVEDRQEHGMGAAPLPPSFSLAGDGCGDDDGGGGGGGDVATGLLRCTSNMESEHRPITGLAAASDRPDSQFFSVVHLPGVASRGAPVLAVCTLDGNLRAAVRAACSLAPSSCTLC